VRADLGRCRHRLIKMLVRRGHVFNGTSRLWGNVHRGWLTSLVFDNDVDRAVVTEYTLAVEQAERRLHAMDNEIAKAAQLPLYREHVAWLRCFRGIDTTIAMIFIAELHGVERFESLARSLLTWASCLASMRAVSPRIAARSPRLATVTFAARSFRQAGSIAIAPQSDRSYANVKRGNPSAS